MAGSIMLEKSKDFAVNVINLCREIREERHEGQMTGQLLRCATSVGANIHESKYGHSKADFIAKMQIALKECYESEYWLELLARTGYITPEDYKRINSECGSLRRMLVSSINTTKENMEK